MSLLRRMLCLGNPCPLICVVTCEKNSGLGHKNAEYNANLCTAVCFVQLFKHVPRLTTANLQ